MTFREHGDSVLILPTDFADLPHPL